MSLCLLAPAIILMGLLLEAQYRGSREQFELQLLSTTRALGIAADREIDRSRATLEALAVASSLQSADFAGFEQQARAASRSTAGWIVLNDDNQQQVVNTHMEPGAALAKGGFPPQAWEALKQGRTRVSGITTGTLIQRPIIAIDRPMLIGGRLYVLSYVQEPAAFQSLFAPKLLPPSWTGAVVDQNGRIIARSRKPEQTVGHMATPDLLATIRRGAEGVTFARSLEGTRSLVAYTRSPLTGWTFAIGVPRRELELTAAGSLSIALFAFSVLIVLGFIAARLFANPISREIAALADDAAVLVREDRYIRRPAELMETSKVREAMGAVAGELDRREAEEHRARERQQTLINELNHRVKNTLAAVQSLAWQTFRAERDRPLVKAFEARLLALSRAHNLLTDNAWMGADLQEVVSRTLQAYGERAHWRGPLVSLSPETAVSLSLVLHELATNAAKYGAFSDNGRVEIEWRLLAGDRLEFRWTETGGPKVAPPATTGFGTRLVRLSIEHELEGLLTSEYPEEGFRCRIELPLGRGARTAARR